MSSSSMAAYRKFERKVSASETFKHVIFPSQDADFNKSAVWCRIPMAATESWYGVFRDNEAPTVFSDGQALEYMTIEHKNGDSLPSAEADGIPVRITLLPKTTSSLEDVRFGWIAGYASIAMAEQREEDEVEQRSLRFTDVVNASDNVRDQVATFESGFTFGVSPVVTLGPRHKRWAEYLAGTHFDESSGKVVGYVKSALVDNSVSSSSQ